MSGFESIVKYATHLNGGKNLDDVLSPREKAQNVARIAHVESMLGDLVVGMCITIPRSLASMTCQAHVYYSLSANWTRQTRRTLASIFPAPQCYYVPERIRMSYKPRLEATELWDIVGIEEEEEREKERFSFRRVAKKNKKAEEKTKFKASAARKNVCF